MPELPEVETITTDLNKQIKNLNIEECFIYDDRVVFPAQKRTLKKKVLGKTISSVYRRSKMIIIQFKNEGYLLVHLKMTGQLIYQEDLNLSKDSRDTKVVFKLSNGKYLNYNDQRTFGKLKFVNSLAESSYILTSGPEPLEKGFSLQWLDGSLKSRSAPIKNLLLNQHFIAGIGNIYASEILFDAQNKPTKQANKLTKKQIAALHATTISILKDAVKCRGVSMRNYRDASGKKGRFQDKIRVYGKGNQQCPLCGNEIIKITQAQRSTFYCNSCQK